MVGTEASRKGAAETRVCTLTSMTQARAGEPGAQRSGLSDRAEWGGGRAGGTGTQQQRVRATLKEKQLCLACQGGPHPCCPRRGSPGSQRLHREAETSARSLRYFPRSLEHGVGD